MRFSALVLAVGLAGPATAFTPTETFLRNCRDLANGSGPGGGHCAAMLEGAAGAFGLLGSDFTPVSASLGYCLPPDVEPRDLATRIVEVADANPDCAQLAHFSMCMNWAFETVYAGTC